MSSSSYLGHGAKYWADRYFELQTQTRMPDNSSAIEWRDKYLSLEKNCALYQSTIADLRTEVADLRQKAPSKSEAGLFEGHTAEYWYNETTNLNKLLDSQYSVAENTVNSLSTNCKDVELLSKEQSQRIQELQKSLSSTSEALDKQHRLYLKASSKSSFFLLVVSVSCFFLGRISSNWGSAFNFNPFVCIIFFISGCVFTYIIYSSKVLDSQKSRAEFYETSLARQKEEFLDDLRSLISNVDLLTLSGAPDGSYLDEQALPHIIVDNKDICTVSYTPSGKVYHRAGGKCGGAQLTTNIAYLSPCFPCSRCYPEIPKLAWYRKCLSNAQILKKYGIEDILIPASPSDALQHSPIGSRYASTVTLSNLRFDKGCLESLIKHQKTSSQ